MVARFLHDVLIVPRQRSVGREKSAQAAVLVRRVIMYDSVIKITSRSSRAKVASMKMAWRESNQDSTAGGSSRKSWPHPAMRKRSCIWGQKDPCLRGRTWIRWTNYLLPTSNHPAWEDRGGPQADDESRQDERRQGDIRCHGVTCGGTGGQYGVSREWARSLGDTVAFGHSLGQVISARSREVGQGGKTGSGRDCTINPILHIVDAVRHESVFYVLVAGRERKVMPGVG